MKKFPCVFAIFVSCMVIFQTGCSSVFPVSPTITLPQPIAQEQKIALPIKLVLNDELRNFSWRSTSGARFTFNPGGAVATNAELMVKKIFTEVSVIKGEGEKGNFPTLTPRILSLERVLRGKTAWADAEMIINLEWLLKDAQGKTVWVKTLRGVGIEKMGSAFSFKSQSQLQLRLALEDVFKKSQEAITSSVEIANFAK